MAQADAGGPGWRTSPPSPNPNLTGLTVYIVNNGNQELAVTPPNPADNVAFLSDTIEPGETGYAKSTGPRNALNVKFATGNLQNPSGTAHISVVESSGAVHTNCDADGGIVCVVTPALDPTWPTQVTIHNR